MRYRMRLASPVLALVCALATAGAARADVRIAVSPESLAVSPGDTFTLELRVPVAGSAFNGYDAIVEYDPAALTFLPTSPLSLQEGPDMRNACGNTFHVFSAAADSLSISHVLLCANISLTGPSHLYTLRFRASSSPTTTRVRLRRAQFYRAGTYVNPAVTSHAQVSWGVVVGVGEPAPAPGLRLVARANPARGEQWLDLASPEAGEQRVAIYDAAGRSVRLLDHGHRPSGPRVMSWDGRGDDGCRVPPGLYLVRYDAAGHSLRASIVRLP